MRLCFVAFPFINRNKLNVKKSAFRRLHKSAKSSSPICALLDKARVRFARNLRTCARVLRVFSRSVLKASATQTFTCIWPARSPEAVLRISAAFLIDLIRALMFRLGFFLPPPARHFPSKPSAFSTQQSKYNSAQDPRLRAFKVSGITCKDPEWGKRGKKWLWRFGIRARDQRQGDRTHPKSGLSSLNSVAQD